MEKQQIPAPHFLNAAIGHMQDRAATYDKPAGERSMASTVAAFNALTGHRLSEEQGWIFMVLLKTARTQQGGFRPDNYEDGAAYFALAGECASFERAEQQRKRIRAAAAFSRLRSLINEVRAAAGRHVREAMTPGGSQP